MLGIVLGGALTYTLLPSRRSPPSNPRSLIWPELPSWISVPKIFGTTVDVKNTSWKLRRPDAVDVEFSNLSGRVVLLDFWGTWCATCVAEMPSLQALNDSLRNEPVTFLAVSDEPLDTLQRFIKRTGVSLPIYQSISKMPEKFQFEGLPVTLILDKTGTVVLAEQGGRPRWNDKHLIKFIRGLY